ncbi:MAG: hypothetical protein ABL871_14400 [Terricaulis sp.]
MTDKQIAPAEVGGRAERAAQAGERAHTDHSGSTDAKEVLPTGELARLEALFFEAGVAIFRALIHFGAASGLEVDRARFVVRLAARAAERRL